MRQTCYKVIWVLRPIGSFLRGQGIRWDHVSNFNKISMKSDLDSSFFLLLYGHWLR